MLDTIDYELNQMRLKGELEEAKHNCKNCRDRVGIPCLKAYRCEKYLDEAPQKTESEE